MTESDGSERPTDVKLPGASDGLQHLRLLLSRSVGKSLRDKDTAALRAALLEVIIQPEISRTAPAMLVLVRPSDLKILDQPGHDFRESSPQGALLCLIENVEDQVPHVLDVYRRSLGGELESRFSKEGESEASVCRIGHATDESTRFKAAHEM